MAAFDSDNEKFVEQVLRPKDAATLVLVKREGGAARVELLAPEDAVAPGQACVFYDGSHVLGGGWIAAASAVAAA